MNITDKKKININGIPAVCWGEKSNRVYIAVHGNMAHKEDKTIQILAQRLNKNNCQVISFDLPKHGDRKDEETLCKVQECVKELKIIMKYAKENWDNISLFACSIGAYFSLMAYKDDDLDKSLFLSPVLDMSRIINNMMKWFNVSYEKLEREKEIKTPIGETLYLDYYQYVKEHPIETWNVPTAILYGDNDDICEYDTIEGFVQRFNCYLEIMEGGEHYFRTDEQLDAYSRWLDMHIV